MHPLRKLPKTISKPWGHELIIALTDSYAGKILHINKGESLSLQYHEIKEESIFVLKGEVIVHVKKGNRIMTRRLKERNCLHIPAGSIHRFSSETGCDLVEISTPQLDDVVRLEDKYGRIK